MLALGRTSRTRAVMNVGMRGTGAGRIGARGMASKKNNGGPPGSSKNNGPPKKNVAKATTNDATSKSTSIPPSIPPLDTSALNTPPPPLDTPPPPPPPSTQPILPLTLSLDTTRKRAFSAADEDDDGQGQQSARVLLGIVAAAVVGHAVWMGREFDEGEVKRYGTDEGVGRSERMWKRYTGMFDVFIAPAWDELLPPAYPPPHGKPYTLVVSLDDLLVTGLWDRQHGWRTAKRPGVDYFLAYISQFYEVVVFTTQNGYTALPILEKLDRYNMYITHKLFREATRTLPSGIVKDLSHLNRDLSKVIILDTVDAHVGLQKENAIILDKWHPEADKSTAKDLVGLIPFLESVAIYKPSDVRLVLKAYAGEDGLVRARVVQQEWAVREAEGRRKHLEEWSARLGTSSPTPGFFSSLFGTGLAKNKGIPPTYLDTKRKEAQQQYVEEKAYLEKNKDYLEKLLEEDMKAQMAGAPNTLLGVVGVLGGNPPRESEQKK